MNISVSDSDVVQYVLDFLHSRKLHDSALALERETGLLSKHDNDLSEDILFLRQLALAGKWETLLSYLEPFSQLDDFDSNAMHYGVLRQQYYEALQDAIQNPNNETKSTFLKSKLNDIQQYCNHEQFEQLSQTKLHDQTIISLRIQCFNELLQLLSSVYDVEQHGASEYENNCLVNTFINALFYKMCIQECIERENKNCNSQLTKFNFSLRDLYDFTDEPASPGLYYWLNSIKSNAPFQSHFEQGSVKYKYHHLKKHKSQRPSISSSSMTNKTTSYPNTNLTTESLVEVIKTSQPNQNNNNSSINISKSFHDNPNDLKHFHSREVQNSVDNSSRNALSKTSNQRSKECLKPQRNSYMKNSASYDEVPRKSLSISPKSPTTCPTSPEVINIESPKSVDVKDSYSEFVAQKEFLRKQKDNLLKDIENKSKAREELQNTVFRSIENVEDSQAINISRKVPLSPNHKQFVPLEYFRDSLAIRSVAFHPGGMVYAVGSNTKTLRICAVQQRIISGQNVPVNSKNHSASPTEILNEIEKIHKGSIYCVCWNDEGTLLLSGSNDKMIKIHSYDVLSREFISEPIEMGFHKGIIRDATFISGHGNIFASAGADKVVYITDCNQRRNLIQLSGHADNIVSLYSWNQNLVASSSQDNTVRIWDLRTSKCANVIGVKTNDAKIPLSICVNHDGSMLAIGQENGVISLYDLLAGKFAVNYKPHHDEVRSVRFNTYGRSNNLLSGSYDGRIVLQDIDNYVLNPNEESLVTIADEKDKVIQCRWHPNGKDFASTSAGKYCSYYYQLM